MFDRNLTFFSLIALPVSTAVPHAASAQAIAAQDAAPTPQSASQDTDPGDLQDIVVTGQRTQSGRARPAGPGEYELTSLDWPDVLPGTNPLALVKNLPGVSFTSTDAYGLDLSDAFLFVRGYRANELALSFEGIPLGDGSYGSVTGNSVLSVGVPDTLGSIKVAPGSVRVSTFSNTADGGELRYALADPKQRPDASLSLAYGSNNTVVTSASLNSGELGANGPRILIGAQRVFKDKYTGAGTQFMIRGNVKVVQDVPWGDVTVFFSAARARIWGYNNTSFDMLEKLGWNGTDILFPDYAYAYRINLPENANKSCGAYTCGELAALRPYDTGQNTVDMVGNIAHRFDITSDLSGRVAFYGASNVTNIAISDVSTPSATGAPFSNQVWQPRSRRFGGTAELSYSAGRHTLSAGVWVERASSTSELNWYSEPLLGQGAPLKTVGPYDVYGPAFQTRNSSRWRTRSFQAYLQDAFRITDAATLTVGFKSVDFTTAGGGVGPDEAPNGSLTARSAFLPHVSLDWRPDSATTMFLDIGSTMIGYRVSPRGNIGPVSSAWAADDQATFQAALPNLKPEKNWNFTVGAYRRLGAFRINLDAYYGIVQNRLLNASTGPQFNPIRTVGIVPRSTIIGTDITVSADLLRGVTLSQSLSLSRFRYDSDLAFPGGVLRLAGRNQPGYPGTSLTTQLTAKRGRFDTGMISTIYANQPFTYSNDIHVPTYWMVNAYASYRLPDVSGIPDTSVRLDINNLLNRNNIGSTGIGGFSASGDYQTFMRAAPRQLLLTVTSSF
ncbi:TonB-dependent receptor [Sphingomonas sp. ERG5]|uniref:TonB-dependent receptor n=1 Tax=Sphingomonas sp. ERG5 TaxID=1381597 RepID=UPI00054C4EAD|nr:TonB-dependent receptor [Sphingomonas sp. ERG5]